MDANNTPDQTGNSKPDKSDSFPKEIKLKYDTQPLINLADAIGKQTNSHKKETDSADIVGYRQIEAQKEGNKIAERNMYGSAILGGITIVAIIISAKALNEATRAADASVKADSIYIATLKWDSIKNAQASFADSVKFQKQFDLASKSLGEQIQFAKTTQKQFEIANRPYLRMIDFSVANFKLNTPTAVSFKLTNYGSQPVRMNKATYEIGYLFDITRNYFYRRRNFCVPTQTLNVDVVKEHPETYTYMDPHFLSALDYNAILNVGCSICFWGKIQYTNLITGNDGVYEFVYQYKPRKFGGEQYGSEFIYNRNDENKDSVKRYFSFLGVR